jgi:hypothetical protein
VGLIANPYSSKDIRRLVGLARVVDVEEKANLIARLLAGLAAGPPVRVLALDDSGGLVRRAVRLTGGLHPPVAFLPVEAEASEQDTRRAALALRDIPASVVVTVGGDGTIRSAVEGWPDMRLAPLAAGTNNAIAIIEEPTVVGFTVAKAAAGLVSEGAFSRLVKLTVDTGDDRPHAAVVDVVGVNTHWTGAGAIWEPDQLVEAVIANARPTAVGIASISTALGPLPPGHARHVRFGPGRTVRAVLGPGLIEDVSIADYYTIPEGTRLDMAVESRVLALDGERRLVRHGRATVDVSPGPLLLSIGRAAAVD